jgi:hypothetical protein
VPDCHPKKSAEGVQEYRGTTNTVEKQRTPGSKPLPGNFDGQFVERVQFAERFWQLWTLI